MMIRTRGRRLVSRLEALEHVYDTRGPRVFRVIFEYGGEPTIVTIFRDENRTEIIEPPPPDDDPDEFYGACEEAHPVAPALQPDDETPSSFPVGANASLSIRRGTACRAHNPTRSRNDPRPFRAARASASGPVMPYHTAGTYVMRRPRELAKLSRSRQAAGPQPRTGQSRARQGAGPRAYAQGSVRLCSASGLSSSLRRPGVVVGSVGRRGFQLLFRGRYHAVGSEAELLLEFFERSRGAKRSHSDAVTPQPDVSVPAQASEASSTETRALTSGGMTLSRYCWSCCSNSSQDGMLTTRAPDSLGFELFVGVHTEAHFAARGQQKNVWCSTLRIGQDVSSPGKT